MTKAQVIAEKNLKFGFKLANRVYNRKGYSNDFTRFENFLWNVLGEPYLRLEKSRWSKTGFYWKKIPHGKWMRVKNHFYFADTKTMMMARLYLPYEFVITEKTI